MHATWSTSPQEENGFIDVFLLTIFTHDLSFLLAKREETQKRRQET